MLENMSFQIILVASTNERNHEVSSLVAVFIRRKVSDET